MNLAVRVAGLVLIACTGASITFDARFLEPIEPFGLGGVIGSGLQGDGTAPNPLDIKAGTVNGQTPTWNGTAWTNNTFCGDPSLRYCDSEEFVSASFATCVTVGKFVGANSGTGATCTYNSIFDAGHPGIQTMQTGSTATGGERYSLVSTIAFGGNVGAFCTRQLVQMNALSNTTTEYLFRSGFMEPSSNADSVDAVEAVYDRATSGDFWSLVVRSNSVTSGGAPLACNGSGGTTSMPVVAGTWYTLEECVNGAGTSATLAVNGTVCATITSGIPTGTSRLTAIGAQCFNNNGSAPSNQLCNIDYVWWSLPFGTAR